MNEFKLTELTLLVLCLPATLHWRAPGPIHHARWMAKLLYAIKIYLFRDQRDIFSLTKKEETQIHRFVQFFSVYKGMDTSSTSYGSSRTRLITVD